MAIASLIKVNNDIFSNEFSSIISPRLALSPQFYGEKQRIEFPQLDIKSRRKGYSETLEQLSNVGEKIASNDLVNLCHKV